MLAIFWRALKDRRNSLIAYLVAGIGFLWMYVALFPYIKNQATQLNELMKSYPESFQKAFGGSNIDISNFGNYLSMEMFSFMWPILLIIFVVAFAASNFAAEIESGTIEILLSQPVSRLKIFFEKYFAGLIGLFSFILLTIFAIIPLTAIYNIDYQLKNFATLAMIGFLFGLAIYSLAILFSTIFSDKGKVYFLSGGIILIMYVLNIISGLKDNLKNLKYVSFFHYYDPTKTLVNNQIDHLAIWVFLGVFVFCTIFGAICFIKRDMAT